MSVRLFDGHAYSVECPGYGFDVISVIFSLISYVAKQLRRDKRPYCLDSLISLVTLFSGRVGLSGTFFNGVGDLCLLHGLIEVQI